jgi:hypothetical protein
MAINIENAKNVSADDILGEAAIMWRKVRDVSNATPSTADIENLYARMWKEHADFSKAYPIVMSEMVQGRYSQKALRLYIKYVSSQAWAKDKDTWLRTQAHYACILYKCIVPRYKLSDAQRAEEFTYQQLKAEDLKWDNAVEEMKAEMARESAELAEDKRKKLRDYIELLRGGAGANVDTTTVASVDTTNATSTMVNID